MYRTLPYIALFAATMLLQVFLFDNLSISVYLNPLIYMVFIVLLPLDTPPVVLLGAGLLTGVAMDAAMGTAGINTIATLPVAFARPMLLNLLCGRDSIREGGVPSSERLGRRKFIDYLVIVILLHHTLFFLLEALSWEHLLHTVIRIVVSSLVTLAFVWIIARVFTVKLSVRV